MSLAFLVAQLRYKPNWKFALRTGQTYATGSLFTTPLQAPLNDTIAVWMDMGESAALVIELATPDSENPDQVIFIQHTFPTTVPPDFDDKFWRRWILNCILAVETHEAMEFFQIGDDKPFFPEHGPGGDLYNIKDKTDAHTGN